MCVYVCIIASLEAAPSNIIMLTIESAAALLPLFALNAVIRFGSSCLLSPPSRLPPVAVQTLKYPLDISRLPSSRLLDSGLLPH